VLRSSDSDEEEDPKKEKKYQKGNRKIKGKSSRKISTQEKTVPHLMKMMKAIVTQREYSLWLQKIRKTTKKVKWILRNN
jgi:hypothetical protein